MIGNLRPAASLAEARTRLAERTLRFSTLFLPVVIVASFAIGFTWLTVGHLVVLSVMALFGFAPFPSRWKSVVVVASHGVSGLLVALPNRGFAAGPLAILTFFCLYATLLYGRSAGLWATALTVSALLGVGAANDFGFLAANPGFYDSTGSQNWLAAGLAVSAFLVIPTFPIVAFLHELSLAAQLRAKALDATIAEDDRRRTAEETARVAHLEVFEAQQQRTLGRMAGGLAHEINGVLQEIEGWIEVLRREGDTTDPDDVEAVREMQESVRRVAAVGRRLLYMGGTNLSAVRSTDLDGFLGRVQGTLATAAGPGVTVELTCEPAPPSAVDTTELTHVLVNLVVNSRDAMDGKGRVQIRLAPDASRRFNVVSVRDDGPGIPPEILPRVFEPFFTTKGRRGTGLGLAIVKRLLEGIGGRVEIGAADPVGTEIRLFIPVSTEESRLDAGPLSTASALMRPGGPPSVRASSAPPVLLFVEDQPAIRQVFTKVVARAGIHILVAESVDGALAILEKETPDLIWSDAIMPGRPTSDLIAEAQRRELPIVICSGHVEEELLRRDIRTQELEFVPKPYTARQLIARTRQAATARRKLPADAVWTSLPPEPIPEPIEVQSIPPLELDRVAPLSESGAFPSAPPWDPRQEDPVADSKRPLRVLIADDDETVRRAFQRGLARLGFQIFEAADGLEAEFVFLSNPGIDVVVLDAQMPHRNGDATARSILRARPNARILLCTGETRSAKPPGILEMLAKPIRLPDLADAIRRARAATPTTEHPESAAASSTRARGPDSKPASRGSRS